MAKTLRGLLEGPKFNGRHQTAIDSAKTVIRCLRDRPEVSKIILGFITPLSNGGVPRLKITPINAGFRLTVRGRTGQQELFVYTTDAPATKTALEAITISN